MSAAFALNSGEVVDSKEGSMEAWYDLRVRVLSVWLWGKY